MNSETEITGALELYSGKTIVVKYGGAAMRSDELRLGVINDIARLAAAGCRVVLVHGGGPELSALQRRLGIETKFVDGLRYTDSDTMDAAVMALCGRTNKGLVRLFENEGLRAAGLSGIDGGLLRCVKQEEPDLGYVGEIQSVNTELIYILLEKQYIPVVSTVGLGEDGLVYNINADTAAGRIAACVAADCFITLSDVPGVLRDVNDPLSLIEEIHTDEIEELIGAGLISGGMIPKVRGLAAAVRGGALAATIVDGRTKHALLRALIARAAAEYEITFVYESGDNGTTITG